jgi:hypothetical protein
MAKSEYLQREEAAKKQLGKKGVQKRVKQLPRATRATARGLVREVTGIDVSRKGVSVDPLGLAMAVSPFKLLKVSKGLAAAGKVASSGAVEARAIAKLTGRSYPKELTKTYRNWVKTMGEKDAMEFIKNKSTAGSISGRGYRKSSTSVIPRSGESIKSGPNSANVLKEMQQSQSTRTGMWKVSQASEVAKKLSKYRTPKGGR